MDIEELNNQGVSEHAGFPNAATDARLSALDLNKLLVGHPSSTFYMRVDSDNHQELGINGDDVIVVDRALEAKRSDLVICEKNDSFTISLQIKQNLEFLPLVSIWVLYILNIKSFLRDTKSSNYLLSSIFTRYLKAVQFLMLPKTWPILGSQNTRFVVLAILQTEKNYL